MIDERKRISANGNIGLQKWEIDGIKDNIEWRFKGILQDMLFDVEGDQQIKDTPKRVAKMLVDELCSGCYEEEPKITVFENTNNYDEMVFLGPIQIKSLCSHHFQNFIGSAYIAYIPDKKICGISKLVRITRWFMRRPQIQEELTKQIADYVMQKLEPKGCAVYIEATHQCMIARGVEENEDCKMKTSDLRGNFRDHETKHEFLMMIK